MNNILVYSATGIQANPLLSLLQFGENKIYAMTRNKATSSIKENSYISVVEADLNNEHQLFEVHKKIDLVMLNLPFFSRDNVGSNAIEVAKKAKVKLVIWNANGEVPRKTTNRHKMNVRLENMERLVASGIPYVVMQPTMYLENLLLPGTSAAIKERNTIELVAPSEVNIPWMSTQDISRAMVKSIDRKDVYNKMLTVKGEGISGKQLASIFSEALGKTINYQQISVKEYIDRLNQVMGIGHGEQIMGTALEDNRATRQADFINHQELDAFRVLNFSPMRIYDWVIKYKNHFLKLEE